MHSSTSTVPRAGLAARVGLDECRSVFLFENHDEAYRIWSNAAVRDRVLLHVDAHHDCWWVERADEINIANFICPAIRDGLVREIVWVVPDGAFASRRTRRRIFRHLEALVRSYPESHAPADAGDGVVRCTLAGRPVTVTTLQRLPRYSEPLLLDIDVDFMVIGRVACCEPDAHLDAPWCWPEQLVEALRQREVATDLVTVCHSVFGAYTPVRWKYLGHEIVERLRGSADLRWADRMREAHQRQLDGDSAAAIELYRAAAAAGGEAHALFPLALLLAREGHVDEARECFRRASRLDPTLREQSAAANAHCTNRELARVANEAGGELLCDPDNPYAQLALGILHERMGQDTVAERHLRRVIDTDPDLVDSYHHLGRILLRSRRFAEAEATFLRAIKLGFRGARALNVPLPIQSAPEGILDRAHFDNYSGLGQSREALAQFEAAAAAYAIAAARPGNVADHLRFARVQLRRGRFRSSVAELSTALSNAVQSLGRRIARSLSRVGDAISAP